MMSEQVAQMFNDDVLDYVTPGRTYVVRLIAHPGGMAHVEVIRGTVTVSRDAPLPIDLASRDAWLLSKFYKTIDPA